MNAFEYAAPRTLDEALTVLREHGEEARVIAGGTALVTMMRQRLVSPGYLISLHDIPGLNRIEVANGGLRITGTWTRQTTDFDFLQVLTRSDGVPTGYFGTFGETQNGVEFVAILGEGLAFRQRGSARR